MIDKNLSAGTVGAKAASPWRILKIKYQDALSTKKEEASNYAEDTPLHAIQISKIEQLAGAIQSALRSVNALLTTQFYDV